MIETYAGLLWFNLAALGMLGLAFLWAKKKEK